MVAMSVRDIPNFCFKGFFLLVSLTHWCSALPALKYSILWQIKVVMRRLPWKLPMSDTHIFAVLAVVIVLVIVLTIFIEMGRNDQL